MSELPTKLPVACCPGCGTVTADPAPKLVGPLMCPRCWQMFTYDPDEMSPVERVEIRAGQLWAPRPYPVRIVGLMDMRRPQNARPEEVRRMLGPLLGMQPSSSSGYYVVADPPFAAVPDRYRWRMVNLHTPGIAGHQMAEPFLQGHYQLVAEAP